jgi:hypothetical protein
MVRPESSSAKRTTPMKPNVFRPSIRYRAADTPAGRSRAAQKRFEEARHEALERLEELQAEWDPGRRRPAAAPNPPPIRMIGDGQPPRPVPPTTAEAWEAARQRQLEEARALAVQWDTKPPPKDD